jgi:hypothetical protein
MSTARRGRGRAARTIQLVEAMYKILEEIQPCSVRAVAYQLFNRKLIDSMSVRNAQLVSRLLTRAREEGEIPWEWVVDQTRQQQCVSTWSNPQAFAETVQSAYRRNKWEAQPTHIELWSEKATVEGTLAPVLKEYEVPFQVLHGWSSATPIFDATNQNFNRKQDTLILYVGDWDPSGMYMSEEDLPRRLARYSSKVPSDKKITSHDVERILGEVRLSVRRIALNHLDTQRLGSKVAFPAATKKRDPRYGWFIGNYGQSCWELDAMSPNDLRERVETAIQAELDIDLWDRYVAVERVEREAITATCQSWNSISQQDQK